MTDRVDTPPEDPIEGHMDNAPHPIETDFEIGQDNANPFGLEIHNPVFPISALAVVGFVLITLVFQAQATEFFGWLRPYLTSTFDWFFLSAANIFVLFCLMLLVTPLGGVRLGGEDAKPDYSYMGWFAMLFAAGMGIGLMFFGVSEPMSHFGSSLGGVTMEGGMRTDWAPLGGAGGDVIEARNLAMAATIFHWALHPWAIYAVLALALAFFTYNRGLPLTLRSAFYPILGERIWGWWGHTIDIIAVFATLFGLATSLGFGTEQALAGLNHLFGWGTGSIAKVVLIAVITGLALISVLRGLDGGVKILSEINIILAGLLLLFIIVLGPTAEIFDTTIAGGAAYIKDIIPLSMPFGREDTNFSQGWTGFYWAWWISWSPFVGMFIARVSRGRTVREFIFCVLVIPTFVCVLWMGAFGGTAIAQVIADVAAPVKDVALELKLFVMLEQMPFATITSMLGILLVLVFFVTSSDSGSLVIDTITAGGKTNAPAAQRVFWCTFEGVVAATLLLVGGSEALTALQAMAVSTGFPFTVVLLILCVSLFIGLRQSLVEQRANKAQAASAS
ncbi:BCCT family transporter [Granulosicoccus antarcticus]|uniref:Glycine betaine/proline betaine transporter BetS n=1 Tax=Granulosicoccus antarcticus IMCC3135 TaxID=1192854 RepID=A0A2Z2NHZ3_9GAMM|nr:BCCT family transporter [Granulosicoccus antarcticus]ASJ70926.1 Glycine betaine/proline betaine transporter BetS [Granulosicoccus antarcticus IMCC3135]